MLAIRLARVGAKKKPSYRLVVIDKRRPRNSRSVEIVGHYNPTRDPIVLSLEEERLQHWLSKGAQPSDTVRRLLAYKGKTSSAEPQPLPSATKEEPEQAKASPEKTEPLAAEAPPPAASSAEENEEKTEESRSPAEES